MTSIQKEKQVMRPASVIARYLAGVIFLVMGLNGFLNFIPFPPPAGVAGQFMGALYVSHYVWVIFAFQVIGGLLLLVNRYVPLAVAILASLIVNVLTFHVLMAPSGLPVAPVRGGIVDRNLHRRANCLFRAVPVALAAAGLTAEERDKTCQKINSRWSSREPPVNKAVRSREACSREATASASSRATRIQSTQRRSRAPARRS